MKHDRTEKLVDKQLDLIAKLYDVGEGLVMALFEALYGAGEDKPDDDDDDEVVGIDIICDLEDDDEYDDDDDDIPDELLMDDDEWDLDDELLEAFLPKPKPPKIKDVIFHDPATIVLWEDGTKTVVKCQRDKGDVFSKETGLALAICKKVYGNDNTFNNVMNKWLLPSVKKESHDAV